MALNLNLFAVLILVNLFMIFRRMRLVRANRLRQIGPPACSHCGYSLHLLTSSRCPECGTFRSNRPAALPKLSFTEIALRWTSCVAFLALIAWPNIERIQVFNTGVTLVFPYSHAFQSLTIIDRTTSRYRGRFGPGYRTVSTATQRIITITSNTGAAATIESTPTEVRLFNPAGQQIAAHPLPLSAADITQTITPLGIILPPPDLADFTTQFSQPFQYPFDIMWKDNFAAAQPISNFEWHTDPKELSLALAALFIVLNMGLFALHRWYRRSNSTLADRIGIQ